LFLGIGSKKISNTKWRPVTAREAMPHIQKCRDEIWCLLWQKQDRQCMLNNGPKKDILSICYGYQWSGCGKWRSTYFIYLGDCS